MRLFTAAHSSQSPFLAAVPNGLKNTVLRPSSNRGARYTRCENDCLVHLYRVDSLESPLSEVHILERSVSRPGRSKRPEHQPTFIASKKQSSDPLEAHEFSAEGDRIYDC